MLNVIFQMDYLKDLNFSGDTTYMLMQEAFRRGHRVYFYHPKTLSWTQDTVFANVCEVTNILDYHKVKENEYPIISKQSIIMNLENFDVLFIRQDPPFDMAYITSTFLLEKIMDKVLILNNPISIRNCPEKLLVTNFSHLMPKTIITSSKEAILNFLEVHNKCVIKPLYGNAGSDVFFLESSNFNTNSIIDYFLHTFKEQVIVQEFIENVTLGDKRIILIDGEAKGIINRVPAKGEIKSNLAAGGKAVSIEFSPKDLKICQEISSTLKELGLFLVGIDVIDGHLTEINVTSPTGLRSIENFSKINLATYLWQQVENKINSN